MTEETNKQYAIRLERERNARVAAAAKESYGSCPNKVTVVSSGNGVYHDTFGRLHVGRRKYRALALSGYIEWIKWVPVSVGVDVLPRPDVNARSAFTTVGANIVIPCMVMERRVDFHWMHGKPLWFMVVKERRGISDSEYVAAMHFKDIHYGQFTVSSPQDAPFFILKHGVSSGRGSRERLRMLRFCMGHGDYREFRAYVRELAWDIMNGDAKVDLTVLRLAVCFMDFMKHQRVDALHALDKARDRVTKEL